MPEQEKIEYGGEMMLFLNNLPIAFSKDAKLSIKAGIRPTSSKDSGNWTDKKAGRLDWNASTDALYTDVLTAQTTTSFDELFALMVARTPIDLAFAITAGDPGAQTIHATKKNLAGKAIITGLDVNAPEEDNSSFSMTLEGTGELKNAAPPVVP